MYPNLTPTLVGLLFLVFAASIFIALRRPILRRLAFRQVARRRREAALVIAGSMLGTAIIVGSLIVGDTLNFSVKQAAYENLGPIDETVTSASLTQGASVAERLATAFRNDPAVDGIVTVHGDMAAASAGAGRARVAEPRVAVWDVDFAQTAAFAGGVAEGSGISGAEPRPGQVVINADLAASLQATAGDRLTFYLYGLPTTVTVARVIPSRGIAGMPLDGVTRDAFFASGTLAAAARAAEADIGAVREPRTLTFVSNAGDVEGGAASSDAVVASIRRALGPLAAAGISVARTKQTVLDQAKQAGDSLGSMFLMIGSFAIIAGILLLVIIFVMLAEERKPELGMLRAIGMKRSRLVRSFIIEGTVYALLASLLGVLLGLAVGRAVVIVAARIYSGFDASGGGGLHLVFHVTAISAINGFALGFLMAMATVTLTSMRISRINIISAIRDLPPEDGRRMKMRWVIVSSALAATFGALSIQALSSSQGEGTYLYPSLAIVFATPVFLRVAPKRWVYSAAALLVMIWCLIANTVRPHVLDDVKPATFVIMGILLTFSAVVLISQNQGIVSAPLRPLVNRTTQVGLSTRLGLAYPLGKRFRTGSILIMYGLVMFTLVFITVLSALIDATVSKTVTSASGGFGLRADFNPAAPFANLTTAFTTGPFTGKVAGVAPLLLVKGEVSHLTPLVTQPIDAVVVGADVRIRQAGLFPLSESMAGLGGDQGTWTAVMNDPDDVIVDGFLGQLGAGGPPRTLFHAGDAFVLTDPVTGARKTKTIVGILDSAFAFYGMGGGLYSPVIMSETAARGQFGDGLVTSSALLKPAPGVSDQVLASELQGRYLTHGLVATRIRHAVEQNFAANRGFFQLMQGFIALGLLVGIAGLGVMMIRAVRERRRSIGVLRALGFQAKTVQRAFLTESLFVTVEGVVIGAGLSILTAYMLFKNYPIFETAGGFSVPWMAIVVLAVVAIAGSLVATLWPARQASKIRPAVALRIAD